jgi:hypothetical protein
MTLKEAYAKVRNAMKTLFETQSLAPGAYLSLSQEERESTLSDELRDRCLKRYGEEFGEIYDQICAGGAILDMYESIIFLTMIENERKRMESEVGHDA